MNGRGSTCAEAGCQAPVRWAARYGTNERWPFEAAAVLALVTDRPRFMITGGTAYQPGELADLIAQRHRVQTWQARMALTGFGWYIRHHCSHSGPPGAA